MKPPLRVLLPYDFSRHSEETLHFALDLNQAYDCHFLLLHVIPGAELDGLATLWDQPADWAAKRQAEVEQLLAEIVSHLIAHHAPLRCETLVGSGIPFREICRVADEHNVGLIVIGTHGRTGLSHLLMGSTAERVVQHAACPVLSIKPKFH